MMNAVVLNQPGEAHELRVEDYTKPSPRSNEVLIRVKAAGVNRPDIFQRQGKYPAPNGIVQDILGLEVSGIIEEVGVGVTSWKPGAEVCALVPGGGYAEYVTVDSGSCLPIPDNISLEDAAAIPEVLFTVWHNVFQRGQLQKGESVLIYGGSGGIGSMAIQLCHLFGAKVYTLASTEEKVSYCYKLGADKVINYKKENLLQGIGNNSVDVILDSLGGEHLDVNLDLLRSEGRLVYINAMDGVKSSLNLMKLMVKRVQISGSTLRARSMKFKKSLAEDILVNAYPLVGSPYFKSPVNYRFSFHQAAEAHALMESRDFVGKIILLF